MTLMYGRTKDDLRMLWPVWNKIDPETGCWIWQRPLAQGYGQISASCLSNGKSHKPMRAHRAAYVLFVGEIPEGHHIIHSCDTKHCTNPEHLLCLAEDEHTEMKLLERCGRGHEPNWYFRKGKGGRLCRTCDAERAKARRARMTPEQKRELHRKRMDRHRRQRAEQLAEVA